MDYRVKRTNARLYGVDDSFLELIQANKHTRGAKPVLKDADGPRGIIGIGLIQKLEASLSSDHVLKPAGAAIYAKERLPGVILMFC